jgi:uncharacterized membrane protein
MNENENVVHKKYIIMILNADWIGIIGIICGVLRLWIFKKPFRNEFVRK